MVNELNVLIKGALLHDIGKICMRADRSLGNHSQAGEQYLQKFLQNTPEAAQLLNCIKYHHSYALQKANIADNDLSYLVYEADNLAAGADRRANDSDVNGFNAQACLESVFNIFGDSISSTKTKYRLRGMNPEKAFNYPAAEAILATDNTYQELVEILDSNFQRKPILAMDNNELLRILEDVTSFVPSSTNIAEVCDISLYVHTKMTAAIASCYYQYCLEKGITNYKEICLKDSKNFRKQETFLLASGDFSGIQNFIYTIPSKGALKSLRGRSFYLEIFMENYIDEILENLNLSRANLLYSGGGHFYLLLPNTKNAKALLQNIQDSCNRWLLEKFGTQLYMALGYAACSAENLLESNAQNSAFAAVSRELNRDKISRYDSESLEELFNENSKYNKNIDSTRECAVCHISTDELIENPMGEGYVCPNCKGLFELGGRLFDKDKIFAMYQEPLDGALEIFGYKRKIYLAIETEQAVSSKQDKIIRIYSKNQAVTGSLVSTRLWLADYFTANAKGEVLDFADLAKLSCDAKHGIERLGVLRADVDNLGAAFIGGFVKRGTADSAKYATLSRYADLSRDLGLFFKLAVGKMCKGELNAAIGQKPFSLYGLQKSAARKVHVIYSGGDDMFLVGAWDELLELAVDIRRAFAAFTNNKLSFSAGLALFTPSYPISKMAEITGMLESAAKENSKEKNSIALFGFDTEVAEKDKGFACRHIYNWNSFTDKVCREKLQFLLQHIDYNSSNANKLPYRMSMLYKILQLVEDADKDVVNIARFAYVMARLQPEKNSSREKIACYNEFSQQMYSWYTKAQDRKELYTALNLLVYYLRETKEE